MNLVVFLVRMTVEEVFKLNRLIRAQDRDGVHFDNRLNPDCGIINLKKETVCGLYSPWDGCGSVPGIQLEKDIALPIKLIRSALPDSGDGYSIESVYGMCESQ